jgi:sterol desaturase/sphingolipid hydroxylase (fatty acid hydroxylase superfamily)
MMHNIRSLKKIHKFHHKFANVLIPSLGISVTPYEYTFAYVLPFVVGGYIVNPNLLTLNFAIGTISLLNIFIHCNELSNLKYYRYFVSPNDHFNHHKNIPNKNTYAAPLINIDNILEDI